MNNLKEDFKKRVKKHMKKYESKSDGDVSDDDIANMGDTLRISSVSTLSARTLKPPKKIPNQAFSTKYLDYKNGLTTPRKTKPQQIEMNPDDLFANFDDDYN